MDAAAEDLVLRPVRDGDEAALAALWDQCGLSRPWNPPAHDIALARGNPSSEVLVAEDSAGRIVGSVMCGHDGHRGWLYYLAVDPGLRGRGLGKRLVQAAEEWLVARRIWKIMLMVRDTNAGVQDFYEGLGYDREPVAVMSRRIAQPPDPRG